MPIMSSSSSNSTKSTGPSEKQQIIRLSADGSVTVFTAIPINEINSSSDNQTNLPINGGQFYLFDQGVKCDRASSDDFYSKRFEKQASQRKLPFTVDPGSEHTNICVHHMNIIQSARNCGKRESKIDDLIDDLSMKDFPSDSNE